MSIEKLVYFPLIQTSRKSSELGAELGGAEEDFESEQGTPYTYYSPNYTLLSFRPLALHAHDFALELSAI